MYVVIQFNWKSTDLGCVSSIFGPFTKEKAEDFAKLRPLRRFVRELEDES